ncbi:MAG: ParA family protein [Burkholderiaceae bacterium]|nr:ParA family protein [Burkholderiaceae bacterium]
MTIVSVFNQKGGVGKTTTALNLAAALARRARAPYAIDLDPQAQLSAIAGVQAGSGDDTVLSLFQRNRPLRELLQHAQNGIDLIPSHMELSKVDSLYGKGYNVVNRLNAALRGEKLARDGQPLLIDCSPLVSVLTLNAIFASDCVIVPISADYLSFKGALQIAKTLNALEPVLKHRVNRRYLLTRFDGRRRMAWDVLRTVEEQFGSEVCHTRIAENVSLAESPAYGKTVFEHAPNSRGAHDYDELLEELLAAGFIE